MKKTQHTTPLLARRLLALALLGALALPSCGENEPAAAPRERPTFKFPLNVSVRDTLDQPIAGAPVLLALGGEDADSNVIGYTDKNGELLALIDAHHETPAAIYITTPAGYEPVNERLTMFDGMLTAKPDENDATIVHANTVYLKPIYRSRQVEHLVWVDLSCPEREQGAPLCANLPIKIDDAIVATTDAEGRAHFVMREEPNTEVRLTIDNTVTGEGDTFIQLEPPHPGFTFSLTDTSQIFTIEESFTAPEVIEEEEEKPKKVKRRRTRKRSTKKISKSTSKKSDTKKKESKKSSQTLTFGSPSSSKKSGDSKTKQRAGGTLSLF